PSASRSSRRTRPTGSPPAPRPGRSASLPTDLDVIRLENAACSVVVAPGLGGRVLSYSTLGREWLWRNPRLLDPELRLVAPLDSLPAPVSFDTWANWGGDKTWPAPQGWDGP